MNARINTNLLLAITFGITPLVGCDVEATDADSSDDAVDGDLEDLEADEVEPDDAADADTSNDPAGVTPGVEGLQAALDPSAELVYSVTWAQGLGPISIGKVSELFCFLTEVRGRFEGIGEYVEISQSGDSWVLGGASQQVDVMARALCIPRSYRSQTLDVSPEYKWTNGSNPTDMGSDSSRVCFLTRVTGKFKGGAERIEAYPSGGRWWLGGSSFQLGVAGSARCVNTTNREGPFTWKQGQQAQPMASSNTSVCGLSKMQGKFEGGGERVAAYVSGNSWSLGGSSAQVDVATAAYCL